MLDGGLTVVLAVRYAVLYSVVPIVLLGVVLKSTRVNRRIIRMVAIASPILYVALPSILGLIVNSFALREMRHAGNVSMMLDGYFVYRGAEMPASLGKRSRA